MTRWFKAVVTLGCLLVMASACSDDSSDTLDSGGKVADGAVDMAVADAGPAKEAGADGSADVAVADMGAPDAAIVTPGWAVSLGGKQLDDPRWGKGVKVDSKGNIYLLGKFKTDITFGSTTLTTKGDYDG